MTDFTTRFDRSIEHIPHEWRCPLTEVIDTADSVRLALKDWEMDDPALILGLTRLVLERHDKQQEDE